MTGSSTTPDCCQHDGLFYPDGGKRCFRHSSPEDRALVADLDARAAAGRTLGERGWPYGPNIDVQSRMEMLSWAEQYGLRRAETRCQNLHWLRKGRCGVQRCDPLGRWADHVTRWSRNGRPAVLVAQPYGLSNDQFAQVAALNDEELQVAVDGTGWYGHGTTFVQVWRVDAWNAILADA
ncbi:MULTISPECIES: hypothetical protein [unclassified Micromonospora]|uniref:hypothetical protein n=1 Tax=unclassified Micromonospora TaxID=2617518 RepID=UPI003331648E